jgi:hypothetical protein
LIFGIAVSSFHRLPGYPSAILVPRRTAHLPGGGGRPEVAVRQIHWHRQQIFCRNAQCEDFILSINSKLHCLQNGTVSFCTPTGIDPVGASHYPEVSCRRKRLHAPAGEERCQI